MIYRFIYWIPTLAWMLIIFYFSSRTSSEIQSTFPFIENFDPAHIPAYFVLGMLAFISFYKNKAKRPFLYSLVLATIYGILDEFHQYFVPTRSAEFSDLIRDFIGAALALIVVHIWQKRDVLLKRKTN